MDRVDRLRRDVPPAEGLERGRALQQEQLVLLDDGRGQVLRREQLVPRDPEGLGEFDEEVGVGRRLPAHRVLTALLDDQRDQGALALEVLEGRRVAADGDDLPRRVPERVEEEAPLLPDDVLEAGPGKLPPVDHLEQRVVEPGVRFLSLLEQRGGERGR